MLAHFIFNPSQLFLLLIDISNLIIGVIVLIKNPSRVINQSFFAFVFGSVAWSSGISLLYITHESTFDTLARGGSFVMLFGLTLFARVFPSGKPIRPRFFLLFIPLGITGIFLPFNLFIEGIVADKDGFVQSINGPLFPLFVATIIGYLVAVLYFFAQSFKASTESSRMQMLYFITGITIFTTSLALFDAILPSLGIYRLSLLGPASSFIFLSITSYAIMRHQLMDIRIVIQRSSIYTLLLSIIVSLYLLVILITKYFFEAYQNIADPLLDSIIMIFGITTMPHIEHYFQKISDRFFFKDHYIYATTLERLSKILNTDMEIKLMVPHLLEGLDAVLHPKSLSFLHLATDTYFSLSEKACVVGLNESVRAGELTVPIRTPIRIIGTFTFGAKRSGDPYTAEDLTLLRTFAAQATVAFEKAEFCLQLQEYSLSLEEKVAARTRKLTQLQEDQRALFDDISHALQTPLTVLKSALQLHKSEGYVEQTRSAEIIEQSIDDLSDLIRKILQLARMESVPIYAEPTCFNLTRLIENVIEYVEIICRQNNIHISSDLTPSTYMTGGEKQIEEVIINLLSNAVHYTTGCDTREISIRLIQMENFLELTVADTGIGISPERLPNVFERFYRSTERDTRDKVGNGLGLAIVKRIVEQHEGTIHAESEIGKGTSFVIRFQTSLPA